MDVSIIIVSYNVCDLLCQCISSIYDKVTDVSFEVIVVDNASSDNSVDKIKQTFPNVKVIASKVNLGFGKANGLGVKHSSGKYLFFLNPDTELINNAVSVLYLFMETHPNVALSGANLFTPDLLPNKSYEMFLPGFWDGLAFACNFSIKQNDDKFNKEEAPKPVVLVGGADMFMRRTVFDEVGWFDERFFMYFEEPIFSHKIKRLNMELYSVPSAEIIHYEGASSKKSISSTTFYFFDSFLKYYHIYYPFGYKILYTLYMIKIKLALLCFSFKKKNEKKSYWEKMNTILKQNK